MTTCPACQYPMRGEACDNPGCVANPSVPEATKERWAAERAKREAEQAEREKLARLWAQSVTGH